MALGIGSYGSGKQKEVANTTIRSPKTASSTAGYSEPPVKLCNDVSVLVVDDNKVNRKVLMMMLHWARMRAKEVDNGKEAVDLHVAGTNFDLIFIDMEMPVMDGPQATRILRQMGVRARMVGVSGNCRDRDREAFVAAGLDEFYVKPLSRQTLVKILHRVDDDISNGRLATGREASGLHS